MGGLGRENVLVGTVEAYDPQTDTWTEKADIPTPRILPAASAVDGKIYVIGGGSPSQLMALQAMVAGRPGAAAQFPLPDPSGASGVGDAELAQE